MFATALLSALVPSEAKAVTFFTEITSTSFPSPQPCRDPETGAGEGCYTNWLVLSDIDRDGDLDVLFANGGGYYRADNAEPSIIYLNDGRGAFRDVTESAFGGAMSRLRQVAVADVDGDGDLDIYQPGGYGLDLDKLWIQTSQGVFQDQAETRLPAGLMSRAGAAHFGDLDGDGDLDLVVGDWGNAGTSAVSRLVLYTNDGTGKFRRTFVQQEAGLGTDDDIFPPGIVFANAPSGQPPLYFGRRPIDIDLADIDGDFDLDILVNHRDGQSRIFLNDGNARFTDGTNWGYETVTTTVENEDGTTTTTTSYTVTANYPPKNGPYAYNQELCDIDGDGDLDLLVDNSGGRNNGNLTQISLNDGTGKFIDETATRIFGEPGSDDNAVKCVDVNNDGHMDMIVASLRSSSEKLLLNDGTDHFDFVEDAFPVGRDPSLGIDVADVDGDGVFDVITGQGESNPKLNRIFRGVGGSLRDTRPPKFRDIQAPIPVPGEPIVFLMAVTDSVTSETGEHVKEVAVNYSSAAGSGKARAAFIGGDLFRVSVPAVPGGTVITLTPTATDRAGNVGTAPEMVFTVGTAGGEGEGEGGAGGTPGESEEGGSAGAPVSTGGTAGTAGTGGSSGGSGGSSDPLPNGPESEGGMGGASFEGSAGEPSMEETGGASSRPEPEPDED